VVSRARTSLLIGGQTALWPDRPRPDQFQRPLFSPLSRFLKGRVLHVSLIVADHCPGCRHRVQTSQVAAETDETRAGWPLGGILSLGLGRRLAGPCSPPPLLIRQGARYAAPSSEPMEGVQPSRLGCITMLRTLGVPIWWCAGAGWSIIGPSAMHALFLRRVWVGAAEASTFPVLDPPTCLNLGAATLDAASDLRPRCWSNGGCSDLQIAVIACGWGLTTRAAQGGGHHTTGARGDDSGSRQPDGRACSPKVLSATERPLAQHGG